LSLKETQKSNTNAKLKELKKKFRKEQKNILRNDEKKNYCFIEKKASTNKTEFWKEIKQFLKKNDDKKNTH
jgi:hypothetical protein